MSKERSGEEYGLYGLDGSFKSVSEMKSESFKNKDSSVEFLTELPQTKQFVYWSERFKDRQEQYNESVERRNHVELRLPSDIPYCLLNLTGDEHVGHPSTHYKRIEDEVAAILSAPNSLVIKVGDAVDGFFFNPAQFEQMEQVPEQHQYANALMEALKGRMIAAIAGDHDMWAKKSGLDPYAEFSRRFNAFYMHGTSYFTFRYGDITYKFAGAHRYPGFSIYNKAHAAMRMYKEAEGADVIFTAHTHQKGHIEQAVKEFGGKTRWVHFTSLGAYKATDEYARKLGFSQQDSEEMYGSAYLLHRDEKRIEYFNDIVYANQRLSELLKRSS